MIKFLKLFLSDKFQLIRALDKDNIFLNFLNTLLDTNHNTFEDISYLINNVAKDCIYIYINDQLLDICDDIDTIFLIINKITSKVSGKYSKCSIIMFSNVMIDDWIEVVDYHDIRFKECEFMPTIGFNSNVQIISAIDCTNTSYIEDYQNVIITYP